MDSIILRAKLFSVNIFCTSTFCKIIYNNNNGRSEEAILFKFCFVKSCGNEHYLHFLLLLNGNENELGSGGVV